MRLGDAYGDLPIPTRSEHDFLGWTLNSTTITSTSQNTTVGNHTLVASWKIWPDLPSSAGATFVNTQALQNSSGGRGKRVVQINTTNNASGTARTYKYSWDGSNWSNGASLVEKTAQGDQTLYVRVYPTGGEHYRGYVQTSVTVHLNKLPMPQVQAYVKIHLFSGRFHCQFRRRVSGTTAVGWASGDNQSITSSNPASVTNDSWVCTGKWDGALLHFNGSMRVWAYHYLNGFIDSDTATVGASDCGAGTWTGGNTTYYYAQDDGTLTT